MDEGVGEIVPVDPEQFARQHILEIAYRLAIEEGWPDHAIDVIELLDRAAFAWGRTELVAMATFTRPIAAALASSNAVRPGDLVRADLADLLRPALEKWVQRFLPKLRSRPRETAMVARYEELRGAYQKICRAAPAREAAEVVASEFFTSSEAVQRTARRHRQRARMSAVK